MPGQLPARGHSLSFDRHSRTRISLDEELTDRAYRLHSRKRRDALQDLLIKASDLDLCLRLRILDLHHQDTLRLKTHIHLENSMKTPDQQTRSRQQNHHQRDLGGDKSVAHPLSSQPQCQGWATLLEREIWIRTGNHPRRGNSANHSRNERDTRGKDEYHAIDADFVKPRQAARPDGDQGPDGSFGEQDAKSTSAQCEDRAFRQQLASKMCASRAERCSNRNFASARCSASQEQPGDIGASDEQHQNHRAEQDGEC